MKIWENLLMKVKKSGFKFGTTTTYTITYRALADFKRRTFKCKKTEYNASGRVKKISFEQI